MGEKSVRFDESESGEVVKRKILFRAVHRAVRDDSPLVLCRASYSNFQILDLDTAKFTKTPYTLLGDAGIGTLVSLGSVIYTLGKPKLVFSRPDYSEYYSHIKSQDDIVTVHEGLSYFDYSAYPNPDWNKGPLVSEDQYYPLCVAHSGKLYAFTTRSDASTTCLGEVYDPQANIWDPLPKPAPLFTNKYKVLPPVVSDPKHGRILVDVQFSLPFLNSIYAYYPADERWDCLVGKFDGNWIGPLALVDGVIYSYARKCNPILQAYDLHTKQWLEVVLTEQFDKDYSRCCFDALHHLGNGLMCLTTYSYKLGNFDPAVVKNHTVFLSVQFRVQRAECGRQVLITPLSSLLSPLDSYCQIYGQIAI